MKISSGLEQATYVLLLLSRLPSNSTINSSTISDRLGVSHSYLKKLIRNLVSENLVSSTSGKNGGFSLAKSLQNISFLDVYVAIEGRQKLFQTQNLISGFLNEPTDNDDDCIMNSVMDTVEEKLKDSMESITLDQLLNQILETYDISNLDKWLLSVSNQAYQPSFN